jgi:D-methionine transport system permease protein
MSPYQINALAQASVETLVMVFGSALIAVLFGLPLGIWLWLTSPKGLSPHAVTHSLLSTCVNIMRSIPFIILMIALIPVTRFLVGSSIGTLAAIVPLAIGATPFFARLVANSFNEINTGLLEMGSAMGANHWQQVRYILLPETLPSLLQALTVTLITLVGYSAMAGTVGGGGLGALAINYGYQRFDISIMFSTVLILIIVVQLLQKLGDLCVSVLDKG